MLLAQQVTTCGLFGLGFPELAVIAGVVVVIFGEQMQLFRLALCKYTKVCQRYAVHRTPASWFNMYRLQLDGFLQHVLGSLVSALLCTHALYQRFQLIDGVAGPSKLPELGKELGKTVKSFQTAAKVGTFVGAYGTAARTHNLAWCRAEGPHPSASYYTSLPEA